MELSQWQNVPIYPHNWAWQQAGEKSKEEVFLPAEVFVLIVK